MADQDGEDQDPSQGEHLDHSNNYYTDYIIESKEGNQSAGGIVEKMGEIVLGMTGGKEQTRRLSVYSHLGEQDVFDICFEENWNEPKNYSALDKMNLNSKEILKSVKAGTQKISVESLKDSFINMEEKGNDHQPSFHQENIEIFSHLSKKDCCFNEDHCDGHSLASPLQGSHKKLNERVSKDATQNRGVKFTIECVHDTFDEYKDSLYPDKPASLWPMRERAFCDNEGFMCPPKKSNFLSIRSISEIEENVLYQSVCNAMTNYRSVVSQLSQKPEKRRRSRRRQSLRIKEVAADGYDSDESFHSSFSDSSSIVDNYFDVDRLSDEEMPLANDELPEWTLDSSEYNFYDPLEPGDSSSPTSPYGDMRVPRAPPPSPREGSPPLPSSNIHHFLSSSSRSRSPVSNGLSQNEVKTSHDDNVIMPVLSFFHQPLDFWIFEVD